MSAGDHATEIASLRARLEEVCDAASAATISLEWCVMLAEPSTAREDARHLYRMLSDAVIKARAALPPEEPNR